MTAYYNDHEPFCCRVLSERVADGGLPNGVVDARAIERIKPSELAGYHAVHLFAGIGGIPLGLRWAEWPEECEEWSIVTGGFPCQPFSSAGKRQGTADARWLWPEMCAVIRARRPAWVLAENVPGIRNRGADAVLADLEKMGYTCWPLVVGAIHAGARHRRQRVWFVAYDSGERFTDYAWRSSETTRAAISYRNNRQIERWAEENPLFELDLVKPVHGVSAGLVRYVNRGIRAMRKENRQRNHALGNAVVPQVVAMIGRAMIESTCCGRLSPCGDEIGPHGRPD